MPPLDATRRADHQFSAGCASAALYVLGGTSGLNAHEDEESLALIGTSHCQMRRPQTMFLDRSIGSSQVQGRQRASSAFFQGQLGGTPLFPRRVTEGPSLAVRSF